MREQIHRKRGQGPSQIVDPSATWPEKESRHDQSGIRSEADIGRVGLSSHVINTFQTCWLAKPLNTISNTPTANEG
jgi:hypothetical protein